MPEMLVTMFPQLAFNALVLGVGYLLMAAGMTMVFSIMQIVNMAHGELYMLGAVFVYILTVNMGFNFVLAFLISVCVVGGLGVVIERYFFRPFGSDLLPSFVVGSGFILIFQNGTMLTFGWEDRSMPSFFPGSIRVLGATMTAERIAVIIAGLALMLGLFAFLTYTSYGRSIRAVAQDSDAAQLQGISVGRARMQCMFIGSGLAAVAGALLGPLFYVGPFMGAPVLTKAFIIVIIGGMGSVPGSILGALLLGIIESYGAVLTTGSGAMLVSFVLLIVMMIVRPRGLLGHA